MFDAVSRLQRRSGRLASLRGRRSHTGAERTGADHQHYGSNKIFYIEFPFYPQGEKAYPQAAISA
jgi:hypothetical protein